MKRFSFFVSIAILLFFSYWSIAPLLLPGFFPMHDDTQVARVFEMAKSLADGMFPVRWVSDLGYGYGYPIFTFYGPFAYYLGGLIVLMRVDPLSATKIMMGIGVLISGIGMYLLARNFWGEKGAVIAGLLYLYAPYHAVSIYVRGAVGEFFGYALIPFVFWSMVRAYKTSQFRFVVVGGVAYALLVMSHNLTAMMVTPFLIVSAVLLGVVGKRKSKRSYFLLLILGIGLVLSSFYWLPSLTQMSYTNVISQVGGAADFREHYICPLQLWDSPWGFGGSAAGCVDGLSYKTGKLHVLLVLFSIPLFFLLRKDREKQVAMGAAGVFLLVSIFFSLSYSKFLWTLFPPLAFIQYPWRFLTLIVFFSSFLGGGIVYYLTQRAIFKKEIVSYVVTMVLAVLIIFLYGKLFLPQTVLSSSSGDYTDIRTLRFQTSKISDEYMPPQFDKPSNIDEIVTVPFVVVSGQATMSDIRTKTQEYSASINSHTPSVVRINLAYFPAWNVRVDDRDSAYEIGSKGLSLQIPEGRHTIKARYESTMIEKAGNIGSLIGVICLIVGILLSRRKHVL